MRAFIQEAKASEFSAIMTNVPWAWTEREEQNDIRIDTFDKDFMDVVCEERLKLHIVLGLNEFPPWVPAQRIDSQNYSEKRFQAPELCQTRFYSFSSSSTSRGLRLDFKFCQQSYVETYHQIW